MALRVCFIALVAVTVLVRGIAVAVAADDERTQAERPPDATGPDGARASNADLTDLSLEQLMDLTVTSASRRPERRSDVPAALYVITEEDIRRAGVTTRSLSMTTITRRACWTFVLALAVHASAAAQTTAAPPAVTFAVLSLVGDEFTVVTRKDEVGSRLDQNTRRSYKVDTSILDEYALDAAEKTIAKLKPGASVLRFSIRDPRTTARSLRARSRSRPWILVANCSRSRSRTTSRTRSRRWPIAAC